jgi:hypothetical protein
MIDIDRTVSTAVDVSIELDMTRRAADFGNKLFTFDPVSACTVKASSETV